MDRRGGQRCSKPMLVHNQHLDLAHPLLIIKTAGRASLNWICGRLRLHFWTIASHKSGLY
jgi:hypothetical protein